MYYALFSRYMRSTENDRSHFSVDRYLKTGKIKRNFLDFCGKSRNIGVFPGNFQNKVVGNSRSFAHILNMQNFRHD